MVCSWCYAENRPQAKFCANCQSALRPGLPLMLGGKRIGNFLTGGQLHSHYEIRKLLGVGAMSIVYGALDINVTGRKVAIKELDPRRMAGHDEQMAATQLFIQEVQTLVQLDHHSLPKISDYFAQGNNQYMVMDYVDGETLQQILARRICVPESEALEWARQLCDVLSYLHQRIPPVVFRDLKPSNIMLDRNGRIKLIDFGIARRFKHGQNLDTQNMGTPGFAAPEQYGKRQTDPRSDIYALSATLYVLLTGYDVSVDPFSLPPIRRLQPGVTPAMEQAITIGLEHEADRRWQTVKEMWTQLSAPGYPNYRLQPSKPPVAGVNRSGPVVRVSPPVSWNQAVQDTPSNTGEKYNFPVNPAPPAKTALISHGPPTQRLAELLARLSRTQLFLLLGGLAVSLVLLVAFLADKVIPQFDVNFPMLAAAGAFAYALAQRPLWAGSAFGLLAPVLVITSWLRLNQLGKLPFDPIIWATLTAAGFMEAWLYFLPELGGKHPPSWRVQLFWLSLMGLIATLIYYGISMNPTILWRPSLWVGGALDGLIGWLAGDTLRRTWLEKQKSGKIFRKH